jgi:hypothetical protein
VYKKYTAGGRRKPGLHPNAARCSHPQLWYLLGPAPGPSVCPYNMKLANFEDYFFKDTIIFETRQNKNHKVTKMLRFINIDK